MTDNRNIVALLLAAIAFVGVTAAMQIDQYNRNDNTDAPIVQADTHTNITPPKDKPKLSDDFLSVAPTPTSTDKLSLIDKLKKAVTPTPPPVVDPVSAESYIVGDLRTGKIYIEKNADAVMPFASMSKIITALVARDVYDATTSMSVTDSNLAVPPEKSGLRAGEIFTRDELLYPLLLTSSNIAAEVLASSSDRILFLELMSSYAWEIGMPYSFFADPSGLSERNAGSARGFFNMAKYVFEKEKDILAITMLRNKSFATTTAHDAHEFVNIHPFVTDSRFLGGKTGHTTEAKDTMLTILDIYRQPIAFIVLRSNDRYKDTLLLESKLVSRKDL